MDSVAEENKNKRRDPKTEPCGTPHENGLLSQIGTEPSIT